MGKNKLSFIFILLSFSCFANSTVEDIRFDQKLNTQLSSQTTVTTEQGKITSLGSYFGKKPVILSFVYFGCPNLCTLVLNGLADAIQESGLQPGKDVNLMSISIDPTEKPSLALAKKRTYLARIGQTGDENPSWNFLTTTEKNIQTLTAQAGFHFKYDPVSQEYNHPSGIIVLTPQGVISRYFFGIRFKSEELKIAINEATIGRSHKNLTEIILNCFHYNPETSKYGSLVTLLLQGISLITVAALATLLFRLSSKKGVLDEH